MIFPTVPGSELKWRFSIRRRVWASAALAAAADGVGETAPGGQAVRTEHRLPSRGGAAFSSGTFFFIGFCYCSRERGRLGRGGTHVMHGRSRMIIDPRIPTMPARTFGEYNFEFGLIDWIIKIQTRAMRKQQKTEKRR